MSQANLINKIQEKKQANQVNCYIQVKQVHRIDDSRAPGKRSESGQVLKPSEYPGLLLPQWVSLKPRSNEGSFLNPLLRNGRNCDSGKLRSKAQEIRIIGRSKMLGLARYHLVRLSLLHRWSQCTRASDSFLLCLLLFWALLLSFLFSFIIFFVNLVFSD